MFKLFDNFRQNDLVFGLMGPRGEVVNKLKEKGFTHTVANDLNDPAVSLVLKYTSYKDAEAQLDKEQYQHFCFLRKHTRYLRRKPGRPVPSMLDKQTAGAAYRRACKLLLTSRYPARNYNAHVVMKDVDWNRVCDKKLSGLGVTDSELRAAYRDEIRFGRNPRIFFYNSNLEQVAPPWQHAENLAFFNSYLNQLVSKFYQQKVTTPAPAAQQSTVASTR